MSGMLGEMLASWVRFGMRCEFFQNLSSFLFNVLDMGMPSTHLISLYKIDMAQSPDIKQACVAQSLSEAVTQQSRNPLSPKGLEEYCCVHSFVCFLTIKINGRMSYLCLINVFSSLWVTLDLTFQDRMLSM